MSGGQNSDKHKRLLLVGTKWGEYKDLIMPSRSYSFSPGLLVLYIGEYKMYWDRYRADLYLYIVSDLDWFKGAPLHLFGEISLVYVDVYSQQLYI